MITSTQKWALKVLAPRTKFGCFLWFLPFFVCLFFLGGSLIFLWESLGLGKPKAYVTMPLFWISVHILWRTLFPTTEELKAFWQAEVATALARRIATLERLALGGDPTAAQALGDVYWRRDGPESESKRALHYFDIASTKLPSAKLKAAAIRQELADAEVKRQRAELEAKVPDILDATCPNCAGLLGMSSVKCHHCGALFATTGTGWEPIPITGQTPSVSGALATPFGTHAVRTPFAKPGLRQQSSNPSVKRIARIALWGAHLSLVISVTAIGLGYIDSGLARLIVVAPFLYFAWAACAVAATSARYFNPKKTV